MARRPPLFEVVEVLALRSDRRTLDIGDVVYGDERVGECVHGRPTVYIANLMLPDYARRTRCGARTTEPPARMARGNT